MQHPQTQTTHKASDLLRPMFPMDGDGSFERPSVGRSYLDPEKSPHPFEGRCKLCDTPMEAPLWVNMDQQAPDGRWLFRGWLPVTCCEVCEVKRRSPLQTKGEAEWQSRCPIEFKAPWKADLGDDEARRRAMAFEPARRQGMVLHGISGAGKTRIMWAVARKVSELGLNWLWIDSLDYVDVVPKEALTVDVLFLDDLGNESLGQQAETRLLKLIRTRCDHHRPFVVTSQHGGDSLAKRFREGASAQAVVRRLREFCESVYVKRSAP